VKELISPLVVGAFLVVGSGLAMAQAPAVGPSPDTKVEKSTDPDGTMPGLTAVGRVKSVSQDSIVVIGKSQGKGAEWTFALDTKTRIRKAGKDVTVADLKEGDGVQVHYMEHGGKHIAQTVWARTRPEAKPAEKKP
jgi:hypothetical protein